MKSSNYINNEMDLEMAGTPQCGFTLKNVAGKKHMHPFSKQTKKVEEDMNEYLDTYFEVHMHKHTFRPWSYISHTPIASQDLWFGTFS